MKVDVEQASRAELIELVKQLLARVQLLEARVQELEAENERLRSGDRQKELPSWVKANRATSGEKKERKKRARGYGRHRQEPTTVIEHAVAECPQCHVPLLGGRAVGRRQVIDVPPVSVEVTDHVVVERQCPHCCKAWRPEVDLSSEVVGEQRIGIHLQTEVAVLRERLRLPFRSIQDYLKLRCGLHVSVGEVVSLVRGVAERGRSVYASLGAQIKDSAVVYGDETGWREDGQNGYLWSFSTPSVRYYQYRRTRAATVVADVIGEEFEGVLVSDFYAGYNIHEGYHQRCWVHLLRDIHELKQQHAEKAEVLKWAAAVRAVYDKAKAYAGPSQRLTEVEQLSARRAQQHAFEHELMEVCAPFVKTKQPMSV
ncbi:MAG: transposase, partial [Acidobacteria bacterium]|nr:transposase [Acidobacteriota bacterium]